jgi:hypothetical protein
MSEVADVLFVSVDRMKGKEDRPSVQWKKSVNGSAGVHTAIRG